MLPRQQAQAGSWMMFNVANACSQLATGTNKGDAWSTVLVPYTAEA